MAVDVHIDVDQLRLFVHNELVHLCASRDDVMKRLTEEAVNDMICHRDSMSVFRLK